MRLKGNLLQQRLHRDAEALRRRVELGPLKDLRQFRLRRFPCLGDLANQVLKRAGKRRPGPGGQICQQRLFIGSCPARGRKRGRASRILQLSDHLRNGPRRIAPRQCLLGGNQSARLVGGGPVSFRQRLDVARQGAQGPQPLGGLRQPLGGLTRLTRLFAQVKKRSRQRQAHRDHGPQNRPQGAKAAQKLRQVLRQRHAGGCPGGGLHREILYLESQVLYRRAAGAACARKRAVGIGRAAGRCGLHVHRARRTGRGARRRERGTCGLNIRAGCAQGGAGQPVLCARVLQRCARGVGVFASNFCLGAFQFMRGARRLTRRLRSDRIGARHLPA
ncbi:hypothetical protein [Ruegeria sp.]|uniref:hypothetical protein n=1 Tax=Ruegeria sp. TaxID=1879320 RepID=UPI003B0057FF